MLRYYGGVVRYINIVHEFCNSLLELPRTLSLGHVCSIDTYSAVKIIQFQELKTIYMLMTPKL